MSYLLTVVENEPRVSHRVVAEHTENNQQSINELIRKYHDEFSEFGKVTFEMEAIKNAKNKVNEAKTYYLNEPQATFLMTLLRNKPIVVEFKKRLVKEFYEMKQDKQTKISQGDLNTVIVEMLKTQQQIIENQQKQSDAIFSLVESLKSVPQLAQQQVVYIDSRDRKKLRDAINSKAKEVAKDLGVRVSTISPAIWIELKNFFDVDDYQDITKEQLKDVMHFVTFWEPKKGLPQDDEPIFGRGM